MTLEQLHYLGFDMASRESDYGLLVVRCSQCSALAINGTPCHETGCPNAMSECHGCNAIVPVNHKYCEDCV